MPFFPQMTILPPLEDGGSQWGMQAQSCDDIGSTGEKEGTELELWEGLPWSLKLWNAKNYVHGLDDRLSLA